MENQNTQDDGNLKLYNNHSPLETANPSSSPTKGSGPTSLTDTNDNSVTQQDNDFIDSIDGSKSQAASAPIESSPAPLQTPTEPLTAPEPPVASTPVVTPPPLPGGPPQASVESKFVEPPIEKPVEEILKSAEPMPVPPEGGPPGELKEPEPGYSTEIPPGIAQKTPTPIWIWVLLLVVVVGAGGYTVYTLFLNKPAEVPTSSQQISSGGTSTTGQQPSGQSSATGQTASTPAGQLSTVDGQRLRDLTQIQNALKSYYDANQRYPISKDLARLDDPQNPLNVLGITVPADPKTPTNYYGYKSADGTTYELSAVFDGKQTEKDVQISKGWLVTVTPEITLKSSATSTSGTSGSTSTTGTSANK